VGNAPRHPNARRRAPRSRISLPEIARLDIVILQDPDGNQIVFAHGKTESHRAVA
jgi:hypothetical protein